MIKNGIDGKWKQAPDQGLVRMVALLAVKDVPVSHTLACSKMHSQHHSYITETAPSPLPFLAGFSSPVFRDDTFHAVPHLSWDKSSLLNSLSRPSRNKQQYLKP